MKIPDETLRAVFDIAVESMDFGSGYLDDDEVNHLRAYAVAIGVDPWDATPSNHRVRFCPGHNWEGIFPYAPGSPVGTQRCAICFARRTVTE